jgi:hypothetical protein
MITTFESVSHLTEESTFGVLNEVSSVQPKLKIC